MKNEILARAMTEIDDELLAEAREPVKKKRPNFRVVTKYIGAMAACFALVLSLVLFGNYGRDAFDVSVDGLAIEEQSGELMLPRVSVHTQDSSPRDKKRMTVPIKIEANGETVVTASEGGILCTADGEETSSLKTKKDTEIEWSVNVADEESFELTVASKKKTLIIKAIYDGERDCLILFAEEGEN